MRIISNKLFHVKVLQNILLYDIDILCTGGIAVSYRKRLHDLRVDNDLRQEDIAQVLKITSQAYGMYENGKRSLPIEYLITLSRYYDVTSDYILGLSDNKK